MSRLQSSCILYRVLLLEAGPDLDTGASSGGTNTPKLEDKDAVARLVHGTSSFLWQTYKLLIYIAVSITKVLWYKVSGLCGRAKRSLDCLVFRAGLAHHHVIT